MNYEDKRKILKHITLGTNEVLYYPYKFGKEPLPVRALSSFELDQCFYNAFDNCTGYNVASFVVKYRIGIIKGTEKIDITTEGYSELLKFYNEIDLWMVYYAMKDFQDIEFTKPDFETSGKPLGFLIVKEMQEVHRIAEFILAASSQNEDVIKEIFEDEKGREIAEVIYYLKVPLTEFSKLTKLQRNYLIYSNSHIDSYTEEDIKDKYVRSGDVMTYKDLLERFK